MKSCDEFPSSLFLRWQACLFLFFSCFFFCARLGCTLPLENYALCQVRSNRNGAPSRTAAAAPPRPRTQAHTAATQSSLTSFADALL